MKTGKCRLCGNLGKLCKSHIISRAFFRMLLGSGESTFYQIRVATKVEVKKRGGHAWETLLCEKCEKHIKVFEDYAIELLKTGASSRSTWVGDFLVYEGIDYRRLKLFQLSVLWRAGISQNPFFKSVFLAEHEPTIREMLLSGNPGEDHEYPCFMFPIFMKEEVHEGDAQLILQADEISFRGFKAYRLCFGSVIWVFVLGSLSGIGPIPEGRCFVDRGGSLLLRPRNIRDVTYLDKMFTDVSESGATVRFREDRST